MSELQDNEIHIQVNKNSPGKRLRKAREDSSLSRKDIAERLHLSEQVIDAIERDDHDHLPAPAFVRGYLRSYAPLVALDADSVVADYNSYFADIVAKQEIKDATQVQMGIKRTGKPGIGKMKAYLALVVFFVVGVWYLTGDDSIDTINSGQESSENIVASMSSVTVTNSSENPIVLDDMPLAGESENVTSINDENDVIKLQDQQVIARVVDPEDQRPKPSSVEAGRNTVSASNQEKDAESKNNNSRRSSWDFFDSDGDDVFPSQEPDVDEAQSVESDSLKLQFHADAWTEVYDAKGDRLLYRLGREGKTYQVSGVAPFKVLLGNAREVTVMLNGQPFDQKPFIRGQVARFFAGKESAGEELAGKESADDESVDEEFSDTE